MTNENVKEIKVDSIKALIDKLKNEKAESGYYAVLADWFEGYKNGKNSDDNYFSLSSFIRGLAAVGFISNTNSDLLIDNLICINGCHFDGDGNEFWVDEKGKRHYTRDEG